MSTPDQRARNLAKQKRFKERHPGYAKKYQKRPLYRSVRFGNYRVFELCDPRDPEQLPHVIAYMPKYVDPLWSRFWMLRDVSRSYWASWMRDLDKAGLQPKLRHGWAIKTSVSRSLAAQLVLERADEVARIVNCKPNTYPVWLFRPVKLDKEYSCISKRGQIIRFKGFTEMLKAGGQGVVDILGVKNGWRFFDG
jgi:hypothetical protein